MEIKTKQTKEQKCKCCNWENTKFFQLDGWDKDDWLCGRCFAEELFNSEAEYQVLSKRDLYLFKEKEE